MGIKKPPPLQQKDEGYNSRGTTFLHSTLTRTASQVRAYNITVPVMNSSYRRILRQDNGCHFRCSLLSARNSFGAKLQDVFRSVLRRASHQPAAFCAYHRILLLLFIADDVSIQTFLQNVKRFFRLLLVILPDNDPIPSHLHEFLHLPNVPSTSRLRKNNQYAIPHSSLSP